MEIKIASENLLSLDRVRYYDADRKRLYLNIDDYVVLNGKKYNVIDCSTAYFVFCQKGSLIYRETISAIKRCKERIYIHCNKYRLLDFDNGFYSKHDADFCYNYAYIVDIDTKGGKKMSGSKDLFRTVMSMKMLSGLSQGEGDMDLGKLYLLQQMSSGEKLQLTDVMKSKLISKLKLADNNDDLPLDKLMLMQMLDNEDGVDVSQIVMMKMMEGMFKEKKED